MAKKKRLTVEECKKQFPEAFQDANGRQDKRITDNIARTMTHMINEGESPFDAKLKAMNIALPPDHFERVDALGAWPKLVYHEDGKTMKTVQDEEGLDELLNQNGKAKRELWVLKPPQKHLDRLQRGVTPRDENIKRLQRELDAEVKKRQEEQEAVAAA